MNQNHRTNSPLRYFSQGLLILVTIILPNSGRTELTTDELNKLVNDRAVENKKHNQEKLGLKPGKPKQETILVKLAPSHNAQSMTHFLEEVPRGEKSSNLEKMATLADGLTEDANRYKAMLDVKTLGISEVQKAALVRDMEILFKKMESDFTNLIRIKSQAYDRFYSNFGIDNLDAAMHRYQLADGTKLLKVTPDRQTNPLTFQGPYDDTDHLRLQRMNDAMKALQQDPFSKRKLSARDNILSIFKALKRAELPLTGGIYVHVNTKSLATNPSLSEGPTTINKALIEAAKRKDAENRATKPEDHLAKPERIEAKVSGKQGNLRNIVIMAGVVLMGTAGSAISSTGETESAPVTTPKRSDRTWAIDPAASPAAGR